jgi:putative ABC transport system permease protein
MRRVPLGRRNLTADRRRLAASVLGVGLAVMLILLLDGMWVGVQRQSTAYIDHNPADLYVLQPGVQDLTAGASALPVSTVDRVAADADVDWAAPVRTAYVILELHDRKVAVYMVGSQPGAPGGPWRMASGRPVAAADEVVVDTVLADRHGIEIGDRLDVGGHRLRVVGTSRTTGFMLSYVFVDGDALAAATGAPDATTAVLVGTDRSAAVQDRLAAQGLHVLRRSQVAANNTDLATGTFGSPIRLMVAIGFAAGTLIIALTAYTAIVERRREYGIVKALGATRRRLVALAAGQTLVLAASGFGAGTVLFAAGRAVMAATRPQFSVATTPGSLARAAAAALLMGVVAAAIPARRLTALEPAVAYRSGA